MIRRDTTFDDGRPAWLLISQVEHARVAEELAMGWGNETVSQLPLRKTLLPTILHHDDGWAEWEQNPTIDPATGRPRAFTEMPNEVAHDLWEKSIESAGSFGPLAQFMVAQHFIRLRRSGDETGEDEVEDFLDEFDRRSTLWLGDWLTADPESNSTELAELAVDWLQLFDFFSLLICCTPGTKPRKLTVPGAGEIELTLQIEEAAVAIDPWPWNCEEKQITATGRMIAAQPCTSDDQLRLALTAAPEVEHTWMFSRQ